MDANEIIRTLSDEWAQDMADAKRRIAILSAENKQLKAEVEELTKDDNAE